MHAAHTAAGWLRIGTLLAFAGLFSVPALSQFTSRAAPEPLVRNLSFFGNSPIPGQTTLYATSLGGGMYKGIDDGTNITWAAHATALPTTRLYSTFFVDQTTFFVLTDGYGLQLTTNGGTSFTAVNGSGATAIKCLRARSITRPSSYPTSTYFVGTGPCPYDSGLYKTTDSGATWARLGVGTIPDNSTINAHMTNGAGTLMIVATAENGLFRSTDQGVTWAASNSGIPNTPLLSTPNVFNIQCGTSCSTFLLANVHGVGVYKSVDGGQTWTDSSSGLPAGTRAMVSGLNRDTSTTPFTYFVTIDGEGVFESTDDGASWHIWGNTGTEPDVAFVRSVVRDASTPGKYYVNKFDGVSRTFDTGANWYTSPMGRGTYNAIAHDPGTPGLAYGVSTTLWKIPNTGAPVPTWLNEGLNGLMTIGVVYQLTQPGANPDVMYATTDHQGLYKSTDRGLNWAPSNTGLATTLGQGPRLTFDRTNPSIVYFGSSGNPGIGFYKSSDGGANWTESNTGLTGDARSISRIIIDRTTPTTLYIATNAGAFKSTNSGDSWTPIYSLLDNGLPLPVNQIFQSTTNSLELYLATSHVKPDGTLLASSGILKSIDGGATWTTKLNKRAQNLRLLNGDVLFAGLADGPGQPAVMRSSDKGTTWVNVSAGMTGYDIRSFGTSPSNGALLTATLENGFYTFNGIQTLSFAAANYNANESGSVTVTVTRGGGTTGALSVQYQVNGGTATPGADFTSVSGTLNFAAGVVSQTFMVPILGDSLIEDAETINLRLFNPISALGNLGLGGSAAANTTITIADNDSTIQFAGTTAEVSETGPNVTLTVTRSGSIGTAASVNWTTANGTAVAGQDFATAGMATQRTGTISWAAGDGAPKTITIGPTTTAGSFIPVLNDATIEGIETFAVNLTTATGGTVGVQNSATVSIVSEDRGVAMAAATKGISETGGTLLVDVTRTGPPTGVLTVNYNFVNGSALNGTHYTGTPGTLTWPDGDATTQQISVPIADNAVVNTARTFTVTLSGATNGTIGSPGSTAVTISDDDSSVQFSAATTPVVEGAAFATLTVTRVGATTGSAAVDFMTADGSALAGTDFGTASVTTQVSGVVNFNAGETSKTVQIPILNDSVPEGAKNFTVSLAAPTGTALGAVTTATVTINDNDLGVAFAQPTYTVAENGASLIVTVNRLGFFTGALNVTWTTANGTAISGQHFGVAGQAGNRTGVLAWTAGITGPKTITIPILNNGVSDGSRGFTIALSTTTVGAVISGTNPVPVTITDDDIPPTTTVAFSQPKFVVIEGTLTVALTATRTVIGVNDCSLPAGVKYSTLAGSALAASDYTAVTNATVSWPGGDCDPKNFNITIVNNAVAEPLESFKVVLSAPQPGTAIGAPSTATVTVLDDDEVFPLDAMIPPGFSQAAGTFKSWYVAGDVGAYEGAHTLKAEQIDDLDTAGIEMSGTFAAGNVAFRVKVSTEADFDELLFYIDDVLKARWSGTAVPGWQVSPNFPIVAGPHTLRWVYSKDGSVSAGADSVQIDALLTPAFTP